MSKFTPGPWVKLPESLTIRARGCVVGDVCRQPNGIAEANACLIAAAPTMYEALKNLEAKLTYFHAEGVRPDEWLLEEWAIIARASIAKADGKP